MPTEVWRPSPGEFVWVRWSLGMRGPEKFYTVKKERVDSVRWNVRRGKDMVYLVGHKTPLQIHRIFQFETEAWGEGAGELTRKIGDERTLT